MKYALVLMASVLATIASAHASTASSMDALYLKMEPIRQSQDKAQLRQVRAQVEKLNQQVAQGPADTGCWDASGMLRAMPTNIEFQWDAATPADAARHLKFWNELNSKYRRYAAQCADSAR